MKLSEIVQDIKEAQDIMAKADVQSIAYKCARIQMDAATAELGRYVRDRTITINARGEQYDQEA